MSWIFVLLCILTQSGIVQCCYIPPTKHGSSAGDTKVLLNRSSSRTFGAILNLPQNKVSEPRLDPSNGEQEIGSPWWSIHAARYTFALPHVERKRVLDV